MTFLLNVYKFGQLPLIETRKCVKTKETLPLEKEGEKKPHPDPLPQGEKGDNFWPGRAASRQSGIGGVPACRQAGRGTIINDIPCREALRPAQGRERFG
jgi:hypothetical protein